MSLTPEFRSRIDHLVKSNRAVLFMKGNRRMPQCGFSARVVGMLDSIVDEYATVDVLSDHEVRGSMKEYSDWPTFPQLYVNGEFVGGCDIVTELHGSGELHKLFGVLLKEVALPNIAVSAAAAEQFRAALDEAPGMSLRFTVTSRFQHGLDLAPRGAADVVVDGGGIELILDRASAERADGVVIDFVTSGAGGGGFVIENPNAPPAVKQLGPKELKALLDGPTPPTLIDVRGAGEHATASIVGARLLDPSVEAWLAAADKEAPIVFHCHHGGRSQAAAERALAQGFRKVFNLAGGIDAWSQQVDSSVPRY